MHTETHTTFIADDGTRFNNEEACVKHEQKRATFRALILPKIGEYEDSELMLGGHALMDSLPFEAPWLTAFGAAFINVVNVRRVNGVVEFQLGDQDYVPYENGTVWCQADRFYSEWPD